MIEKKYLSILKTSMQNTMAYKSAFIINISGSLFYIVALFFLWRAIFGGGDEFGGYSWNQMKAYLVITFVTNTLLSWYSETAISRKILDGSVAMDLLKPVDFRKARLAETIGSSIFEAVVAITMAAVILIMFSGGVIPSSPAVWAIFLISFCLSLMTKFGIVYIASLLCFFTSNAFGIVWTRAALTNFFSGALVPLTLLPAWLESIARTLPFQGIVFIPASIYLEKIQGVQALKAVGLQIFWVIVLWLIGKWMWSWASRQVTIYGG